MYGEKNKEEEIRLEEEKEQSTTTGKPQGVVFLCTEVQSTLSFFTYPCSSEACLLDTKIASTRRAAGLPLNPLSLD